MRVLKRLINSFGEKVIMLQFEPQDDYVIIYTKHGVLDIDLRRGRIILFSNTNFDIMPRSKVQDIFYKMKAEEISEELQS